MSGAPPEWSDAWLALHQLCPEALAGAAEILDTKDVTQFTARESGRRYHIVDGHNKGQTHTVIPGFCTCMSFCTSVASRPQTLVCKHELAVMLADSLGLTLRRELDDAEWAAQYSLATTIPMMQYDANTAATAAAPSSER